MKRFKVHLHDTDRTACTYYRAALPYRHCRAELADRGIDLTFGRQVPDDADAICFTHFPGHEIVYKCYRWRCEGKVICLDLDDNIFRIPDWNPAARVFSRDILESIQFLLAAAHRVSVTTQPLADFLDLDKTVVLPNLIDGMAYREPEPHGGRRRVLWAGSNSHVLDLVQIVPAVRQLVRDCDDVQFLFVGLQVEGLLGLPPDRCLFMSGVPVEYYPEFLHLLAPDVALAPLTACEFNVSKSPLRLLEMTAAGAAVVASDFGPYAREAIGLEQRLVRADDLEGWSGPLIAGDTPGWVEGVVGALETASLEDPRARVREEHSWGSPARRRWVDFFASLPGLA